MTTLISPERLLDLTENLLARNSFPQWAQILVFFILVDI